MLALPDSSDPPLYLYNLRPDEFPANRGALLHHPLHAITMYETAVTAGMTEVELKTRDRTESAHDNWVAYMVDKLSSQ